MVEKCPSDNTAAVEQAHFWDHDGFHWDAHRIGWAVAGTAAAITTIIAMINILSHALHYHKPLQQRQVIRILLFPVVYAVISFFSYRFFRAYTYYELAESAYEALAIAAFLMLLLQYVGESRAEQTAALHTKDKRKFPFPFWCIRYRPSKPYFLHALKWSVLQYCIVRPLETIIGIICEAYNVLCPGVTSVHFANVYLEAVDFVSITIALYGLIIMYDLMKKELQGRRPLAKFMTIKLGIILTFYQGFIFNMLEAHGKIKGTEYWTPTNIADGLNALCVTLEMILIAGLQFWAFPYKEYEGEERGRTNPVKAILHALNFYDFVYDFWLSTKFAFDYMRGKPGTSSRSMPVGGLDFAQVMGHPDDDESIAGSYHDNVNGNEVVQAAHSPISSADVYAHASAQEDGRAPRSMDSVADKAAAPSGADALSVKKNDSGSR